MLLGVRRAHFFFCLLLCGACHHNPPALAVATATDLGKVADSAAPGLLRDGGASILLGGGVLWTFGDTLFPVVSVDGTQLRSNTAALAAVTSPLAVKEPLMPATAKQTPNAQINEIHRIFSFISL